MGSMAQEEGEGEGYADVVAGATALNVGAEKRATTTLTVSQLPTYHRHTAAASTVDVAANRERYIHLVSPGTPLLLSQLL